MVEMTVRVIGRHVLATALILLAGTAWSDNGHGNSKRFYSVHTLPEIHFPPGSKGGAAPTAIVSNASSDFVITPDGVPGEGGAPGASAFLFTGENGKIMGWSPTVNLGNPVLAYDDKTGHAIYKGLALAQNSQGNFLYATDFHNGKIDVFDRTFTRVTLTGMFKDTNVPQGYAPFGIGNIHGDLYVTFAKQDANREDDVRGVGFGFVDVFDANGNLIRRVATGGSLNAPWGVALAPADFGQFSNRLLVGNFGDGTIDAFDPATGEILGQLRATNGQVLKIDNLWGLSFDNGLTGQPTNSLFFTSRPGRERHGLYGRIDAAMSPRHDSGLTPSSNSKNL